MKEELNPVVVELILLNCRYLSVLRTKKGVKVCVFVIFSTHSERGFLELPIETTSIQNNFYPVTDA